MGPPSLCGSGPVALADIQGLTQWKYLSQSLAVWVVASRETLIPGPGSVNRGGMVRACVDSQESLGGLQQRLFLWSLGRKFQDGRGPVLYSTVTHVWSTVGSQQIIIADE